MANNTIQSDIFKFVSLRPPVSADKKNQEVNFIKDARVPEETPPGNLTRNFNREDGTEIPAQLKDFIRQNEYDLDFPQGDEALTLAKIIEFARSIDQNHISNEALRSGIEQILDRPVEDYYRSDLAQSQLNDIWDRYYAFYMLAKTEPQNLEQLTQNLRAYHLLDLLIKDIAITDQATLSGALAGRPLVPKIFSDLPKPKVNLEAPPAEPLTENQVREYKQLWADLVNTHLAIEEVQRVKFTTKITHQTQEILVPNNQTGKEDKSKLTLTTGRLALDKSSFAGLHQNTKTLLKNLNITEATLQVPEAMALLQNRLERANTAIGNVSDPRFMSYMPAEAKQIQGISAIAGRFDANLFAPFIPLFPFVPPTNVRASIKPLGIGDLKVVKQKLKKYVAGEVAHIENVLRGEYKERKHRVLDRTEDILTVSTETEEETTKDTQTTERFELKKESEKTIQEQMSVQAGVTVSGSYGMVTFGAHGDFAYSTASQESNKNASNYAREVIDRSVSKIQKKIKEERVTKTLHEVEEINTHGIDNKGKPDHVTGIYRWVDKYYEAQIYNYGKRMMFEFIIPEPAAFWEYAQTHQSKKDIVPPVPLPKGFTHKSIDTTNYQDYIGQYNVQGVTPPPLPFKTISASIVKDGMPLDGNSHAINSKELVVPAGYISKVGVWWDMSAIWSHYSIIEVAIGNKIFRPLEIARNDGSFDKRFALANQHDRNDIAYHWFWPENPIQVSVNTYDVLSYTLNVYALVERTWEAYEQWQIQTFEKIMTAYKALQAEYEQKVAAQQVQQGVVIHGQNPRINRQIEKTELKKHCVKMLMDTYLFGTFDAMKESGNNPPDFDIFDALSEGKTVQFFEQAFEWENITYLFYPYFWGRYNQWVHKIGPSDPDPLFAHFLQAGSARVVLPVHPAYNDSVMYFLENNGAIWNGGETPCLNDPMFLSLADELRNQTDDLAGAAPEGDPWEVVLPTTLVYLQKESDLPVFIE